MIKIRIKLNEAKKKPVQTENLALLVDTSDESRFFLVDLNTFSAILDKKRGYFKIPPGGKIPNRIIVGDEMRFVNAANYPQPLLAGAITLSEDSWVKQPCFNAINMSSSAMHEKYVGRGYGKLLYKLGLAYASLKGRPVMPDRFSVSNSAAGMWKSFDSKEKGKVTTHFNKDGTPTFEKPSAEDMKGNDPNIVTQMDLPPDHRTATKVDDCDVPVGHPEVGDSVNKAYYSKELVPTFKSMKGKGDKFMEDNFESTDKIYKILRKEADTLFNRVLGD